MSYSKGEFQAAVTEFGEVFFVLDSDREYEVHGQRSYSFIDSGDREFVEVEGMQGDEYVIVQFPLDAIEHHYSHKEI